MSSRTRNLVNIWVPEDQVSAVLRSLAQNAAIESSEFSGAIETIEQRGDGTLLVRGQLSKSAADVASKIVHSWAEGHRTVRGWMHTYKNFCIALEAAKGTRPYLAEKLQETGGAKGAIWEFTHGSNGGWEIATVIRGDILVDFAATLKTAGFAIEAATIETALGLEVPAYPADESQWPSHYWEVLNPIYRKHFAGYRWTE